MKYLLILFLISCSKAPKMTRKLGEGASCVDGYDHTYLCTKYGKPYICYPEADAESDGKLFCFEAIDLTE